MGTDRSQGASPDSNSGKLSARVSPRLLARVEEAVEDGPYHSRSHFVRTALQLLLPAHGSVRSRPGADGDHETGIDGVRLGSVREAPSGERPPHLTVEVVDDRGSNPATHTFVYGMDRIERTAILRSYDPPTRLTHEQATSLGTLRDIATTALAARNWHVDGPTGGVEPTGRDEPAGDGLLTVRESARSARERYADGE